MQCCQSRKVVMAMQWRERLCLCTLRRVECSCQLGGSKALCHVSQLHVLQVVIPGTQLGWICCGSAAACTRAATPSTTTPNASCTAPHLPQSQRPASLNPVCKQLASLNPVNPKLASLNIASTEMASLKVRSVKLAKEQLWECAKFSQTNMYKHV